MKEKLKTWFFKNWFKTSIIIIAIVMVGSAFYWYELRPSKIKHDCSWVKKHSDAIPEITQVQYDECINECNKPSQYKNIFGSICYSFCEKPRSVQPAKDWWQPATKDEYDFCIHEKGL